MISEAIITAAVVGVVTLLASLLPGRKRDVPWTEIVGGDTYAAFRAVQKRKDNRP